METKLNLEKIAQDGRSNCGKCKGEGTIDYICHDEWHTDTCSECGPKYTESQVKALIMETTGK